MKIKDIFKITIFPILILVIHFILIKTDIYEILPFIDIPMHFLGGCAIAFSFIFLLKKLNIKINNQLYRIIVIVSFVGLVAIFWEFFEFGLDYFFKIGLSSLEDTLLDLFFGLLGGLIISLKNGKNI